MEITKPTGMAALLAARIRDERMQLTARWLDRISARVNLEPRDIFPTDDLLDHVPLLLVGIADYLEDPRDEITADLPVITKAMELGALRFEQGFDAAEILKEYEILGGVLFAFSARVAAEEAATSDAAELLGCAHRLFRAISVIEQVTTTHYLRSLGERVAEREERLRRFSRLITHELKNRVGATLGAGQLLQEDWLGDGERRRFAGMVAENAQEIQKALENLAVLSRLDEERRQHRNILLREVVNEVFRQLRELAKAREVELHTADDLPGVEVNAAAVELCLSNYLSNAIKYSDPSAAQRWAEVSAVLEDSSEAPGIEQVTVRVRDNGIGVPVESRDQLFERFFRAHTDVVRTEGTGLGLSLVQETVASLGGRAWAEFDEDGGSVFAFSLPSGRDEDTARRGVSDSAGAVTKDGDRPTDAAPAKVSD
jgi:signal transduction histidine kinase